MAKTKELKRQDRIAKEICDVLRKNKVGWLEGVYILGEIKDSALFALGKEAQGLKRK